PLERTVITFGSGFYADYVVAATDEENPPHNRFRNLFPSALRNQATDYIHQIPIGIPKLDRFIKAVTTSQLIPSIVYHLSNLDLEPPQSLTLIPSTLIKLLKSFPEYRIVFRPIAS